MMVVVVIIPHVATGGAYQTMSAVAPPEQLFHAVYLTKYHINRPLAGSAKESQSCLLDSGEK